MEKRQFLRTLGITGLALAGSRLFPAYSSASIRSRRRLKHWAWIATDTGKPDDEWKTLFKTMRRAGIDAIIPEVYNGHRAEYASKHLPVGELWLEQLLPLAKAEGLEVHAWMWCMPCNIESVREEHPEWFAVNGKGESAADKPAYVEYYRFLCPSRPEVHEFIRTTVSELSEYKLLDGIHFDYIRYPDVILAEGIQPKYNIVQDREYPQYDYCYCDVCRNAFRQEAGIDISTLEDPSTSEAWRSFRYDRITNLVNRILIPVARERGKEVSAAVFPNWEMVRQQWSQWDLDAVMPMLYHGFYNKDIGWIGEQTRKGITSLKKPIPLYSGLFMPQLTPDQLEEAITTSIESGAGGVCLFSANITTGSQWERMAQAGR